MTDRLALAVNVRKARRTTMCPTCQAPIRPGMTMARLSSPGAWIHTGCVPVVAAVLGITTQPAGSEAAQ
ncbi:MAG: hypothetical protein J2P30_00755 [Actinobacteria bacterium]|nr:hypothetical protein [Actinomycetota bacterium]